MKKLMIGILAAATMSAFAEGEIEKQEKPLFWGFANAGVYSGYQLYGSLVNNEPTFQWYAEGNFNLAAGDLDLGYAGVGLWSNTDLTKRRRDGGLGQFLNEYDPNIHWGRTFWLDDDNTWGVDYRSTVVWFYYPPQNYSGAEHTHTTWDWDHSLTLVNPYVLPYVNIVREYSKGANLLQFGVKKPFQITDEFSLCPILEMVWRERQYNWCFPTRFGGLDTNSGLATFKAELDGTYMFNANFGVFAKIAFCSIIDPDLRDNVDQMDGAEYGAYATDFVWGGVGVCCNF